MDVRVAILDIAPLQPANACMARPGFFPLATDGKKPRLCVRQLSCVLQFIDCIIFEEYYFSMADILIDEFCNQRFLDRGETSSGREGPELLKNGEENAARELRLQVLWTRQLAEELVAIGAPVVKTIDGCLDPDRAYELLPGKTRSSTLKRYVTMYKRWRLWLQEAKRVDPPGRPADLIDYLLVLRDEPCARTVPDSLLKSISWMERVAEFKVELRATQGRLAWAAKDKIVEVLHEGAPLIWRAPRYPVMVLVIFERVVMDDSEPTGLRVCAWAKLVKVWALLRWSDLQAIRPGELKLVEDRLATRRCRYV